MAAPPIRTAVIGVGHLGYHHARLYHALAGATLVGVYDTREDHAQKVADEFEAICFPDVDALIKANVQAVSVAVPTTHHHVVVCQLLEAGIAVLVEKPIATTLEVANASRNWILGSVPRDLS